MGEGENGGRKDICGQRITRMEECGKGGEDRGEQCAGTIEALQQCNECKHNSWHDVYLYNGNACLR